MSRRKPSLLLTLGLMVAFAVGLGFLMKQKPGAPEQQPLNTETPRPTAAAAATQTPQPQVAVSPAATPSGQLEFPTLNEVREQVSQDPHHTPPALLQFARDLSERADASKGSPAAARAFFETLEECLDSGKEEGETVPVAAQTLCLTEAEEFAKLYPQDLGPRLAPLEKNASPEVKKIRSALDRF